MKPFRIESEIRTFTIEKNVYRCEVCGRESYDQFEIIKCQRLHGQKPLYAVGDFVEFQYGDGWDFMQGLVMSIDDTTSNYNEYYMKAGHVVPECAIISVIRRATELNPIKDEMEKESKTLPDLFQWSVEWDHESFEYVIKGRKR